MPKRSFSRPARKTPVRTHVTLTASDSEHELHAWAHVWAALTIAAFPISMFAASRAGFAAIPAFFWGMLGTFGVLLIHFAIEQRVWMMDARWRRTFDEPEFAFRLAVVSGALLFLVESVALVYFFTEPGLDQLVLNIVFTRECHTPASQLFQGLCRWIILN